MRNRWFGTLSALLHLCGARRCACPVREPPRPVSAGRGLREAEDASRPVVALIVNEREGQPMLCFSNGSVRYNQTAPP
jgi:hypothetical protein